MKKLVVVALMIFAASFAKAEKVKIVDDAYFNKNVFDVKKEKVEFKGKKPVILDMYADWCPPCKKLAPVLKELNGELSSKIDFIKINTDHNPEIPEYFGVQGIPTIVFITKQGKYSSVVGFHTKEQLQELIKSKLGI